MAGARWSESLAKQSIFPSTSTLVSTTGSGTARTQVSVKQRSEDGLWLGVLHRIGTLMSFWVLTSNGKVLLRTTTVQGMTQLEAQLEENKTRMQQAFTAQLSDRVGGNDIIAQDEEGKQRNNRSSSG
jgi:hypothetical protein